MPRFRDSLGNLINLLRVAGILAIASYGQAIIIITAGLDFSVGSAVALTSVVTVLLVESLGTASSLLPVAAGQHSRSGFSTERRWGWDNAGEPSSPL